MGIYIKDVELPKKCQYCPCSYWNHLAQITGCELVNRYVPFTDKDFWENDKPSWCPLVEVPPHGRLIDADEMISPMEKTFEDFDEIFKGFPEPERKFVKGIQNGFIKYIKDQPTVIPEEEEQ